MKLSLSAPGYSGRKGRIPLPLSPLNDVSRETDVPSGPSLSSPREGPGLPASLDLERFQAVQLCSADPPHCCEEYWYTHTEEEGQQLIDWQALCLDQLQGVELRPDIERTMLDEEEIFVYPFLCSLLRELRKVVVIH